MQTSTWWIHWTVVWASRWNNFSFFHCKITTSVSKQKENLKCGEVIILGDFPENFSFIVEDEIQGYHWIQQCSLHPIVLYYRKENEFDLVSTSICFISDDLNYDVNFVYEVVKDTIKVGLSHAKRKLCYLLDWKPFKNDEKCFLFHLKSFFRSQDI